MKKRFSLLIISLLVVVVFVFAQTQINEEGLINLIKRLINWIIQLLKGQPSAVCIQVITPAINPLTGECKEFPTPCDVPSGWQRVEKCEKTITTTTKKECIITGCSGKICAEEPVATICEWRPEYACYKKAKCERQPDGKCGWTMTPELRECLRSRSSLNF